MRKLYTTVIALLILISAPMCWSQTAEEAAARNAEQAGKFRDALTQYTAALQRVAEGSADEQRLREAIIRLALRLRPTPTVPEDARRYMARAMAAVEIAKTPEDLKRAAAEFQQVLLAAPWLANGYHNLAVLQEKSGDFQAAMRNFKFYLLAAPQSADAEQIRSRIYALEFKAQRQQEEAATGEKQRLARQREEEERSARQGQIAGDWYDGDPTQEGAIRYQVTMAGNSVEIRPTWMYVRESNYAQSPSWVPYRSASAPPVWRGTMGGLTITGTFYGDNSYFNGGSSFTRPMSGSVSPDGNTLRLQYKSIGPRGTVRGRNVERWEESDQEIKLFRR